MRPFPPATPPPEARQLRRKGLALRAATQADLPLLRALYAASRARELSALPWPEAAKAQFLARQFELQHDHLVLHHPHGDFWLVSERGEPVGRLYLDRTGPTWRVTEVTLLPPATGRGIGSALLQWVQHAAAAAGVGIDLHVARENVRAASLYARLGFIDAIDAHPTHRRLVWRPDKSAA